MLASLLLSASTAHAAASLRYSWDDCASLVLEREFTGPGHYVQTLSVTGLTERLTSFQVEVVLADASVPSIVVRRPGPVSHLTAEVAQGASTAQSEPRTQPTSCADTIAGNS